MARDDRERRAPTPEEIGEVTRQIEREELARGHVRAGEQPTRPRPAATIVLARRPPGRAASGAFEVLLLRRPDTTRFAAGAYVFAGGTIDPDDASPGLGDRLGQGMAGAERPALIAALRELFEETGILLADREVTAEEAAKARAELLEGRGSFGDVASSLELTFRDLRVAYFARWITPRRFRRRYDTRFFLAEPPGWAAPREPELTAELAGHVWLTPADAVRRFAAGSLPMLFPTRTTLQRLSRFPDLDSAFAAQRSRPVQAIEPRIVVDGDEIRPVLPGEPGYEDAG